jgi:type II secretion system protein H
MKMRRKRRSSGGGEAGFTLLEIMIVVAMIAIMAAIAVPNFSTVIANSRLKAAARDLYSKVQQARSLAIRDNQTYAIGFDAVNNQMLIFSDGGADNNWNTFAGNTTISTIDLNGYGSGVTFGGGGGATAVGGGAIPADGINYVNKVVQVNSRGIPNQSAYVYLTNRANARTYAVGTLVSGAIRLRKWVSGGWSQ